MTHLALPYLHFFHFCALCQWLMGMTPHTPPCSPVHPLPAHAPSCTPLHLMRPCNPMHPSVSHAPHAFHAQGAPLWELLVLFRRKQFLNDFCEGGDARASLCNLHFLQKSVLAVERTTSRQVLTQGFTLSCFVGKINCLKRSVLAVQGLSSNQLPTGKYPLGSAMCCHSAPGIPKPYTHSCRRFCHVCLFSLHLFYVPHVPMQAISAQQWGQFRFLPLSIRCAWAHALFGYACTYGLQCPRRGS